MKDGLAKAMDELVAVNAAASGSAGNDNADYVLPFDDIKQRAESLTANSSVTEVMEVVKLIYFSNLKGLELGTVIGVIAAHTSYGKNDIKAELKKLREAHALHPADPAMAVVNAIIKELYAGGDHLGLGTDGRFWTFRGTHWEPRSKQDIWSEVVAMTEKIYGQSKENLKNIATNAQLLLEAKICQYNGVFDPYIDPLPVINCRNGEIWLNDDGSFELQGHDPGSKQTYCLNVDFDPQAECPEFDNALKGIFQNAEDPEGMIRHFLEVFGYALQPKRDIPVYVVFFGAGRNGKTKTMETLFALIGRDGYYVDRVNKLEASRFTLSSLAGKRVFVDDDVTEGTRLPDGLLKTMSEAKEMSAEHKFKPRFMFVCRVVPFMLCNNYPNLTDLSVGMQRRAMVIPFAKTFSPQEVDPHLFDRIEENELAGVLNRALEGLKHLRERGGFEYPVDVVEANADWFAQCSSLAAFIRQQCKYSAGFKSKVSDLYQCYELWTDGQGFKHVTTRYKMKSELQALGYTVKNVGGYPYVYGLKYDPGNMLVLEPTISQEEQDEIGSSL